MESHRKLSFGLATLLGGEIAGQDIVKFIWDQLLVNSPLHVDPMPDKVASGLFAMIAAYVWYRTRGIAGAASEPGTRRLSPPDKSEPEPKKGDTAP